jgi:hypothetical protein
LPSGDPINFGSPFFNLPQRGGFGVKIDPKHPLLDQYNKLNSKVLSRILKKESLDMANGAKKGGGKSPYATNGYGKIAAPGNPVKNPINSTKKSGNDLRVKGGKG